MNLRYFPIVASAAALVGALTFGGASVSAAPHATQQSEAQHAIKIPSGTILAVQLAHGFSSKSATAGRAISARVMQDVPLPDGAKVPAGSTLMGSVISSSPLKNGQSAVSFRFDRLIIHRQSIPVVVDLRAIAGFIAVQEAQTPEMSPGFGTPGPWITTEQIGGDQVYGVGSPVTDARNERVGEGVYGGVLVRVRAHPEGRCRGPLDGDDRLQALWVFSSDACGVYGMEGITIAHAGRSEPLGEIRLSASERDVLVRSGDAMLLRVVR